MTDSSRETVKPRILFLLGNAHFGGTSTVVLELLRGIDKERFDLYLASPDGEMLAEFSKYAIETLILQGRDTPSFSSIKLLIDFIKSRKISVVHSHLPAADIIGGIVANICGIPALSTIHALYYYKGGIKKRILSIFYRGAYYLHKSVIAVSNTVKKDIIFRTGLTVTSDKVTVIYNGVKEPIDIVQPVTIKGILHIGEKEQIVGMIGRMNRLKGFHILLNAIPMVLSRHPNTRFILIGDGEEKENLEKQAKDMRIADRLIFIGYTPDVYNYIQVMEVVVLSSLSEGFGLAVVEAMTLKKPVVASNIPAVAEIVNDNETGFLFAPGNSDELAERVLRLLNDPVLCKKMGDAGWRYYSERFLVQKMVSAYEKVYEDLSNSVVGSENA